MEEQPLPKISKKKILKREEGYLASHLAKYFQKASHCMKRWKNLIDR